MENQTVLQITSTGSPSCSVWPEIGALHRGESSSWRPSMASMTRATQVGYNGGFTEVSCNGESSSWRPSMASMTRATNQVGYNGGFAELSCNGEGKEKKVKKPRFAFQTRSQVDVLDDGYKWRKYGQKAVKNNKFPRSYYRCSHQGCNVKKQVQRLNKDEGVVVTTYDGIHTHPIAKPTDNFEQILSQMNIYSPI